MVYSPNSGAVSLFFSPGTGFFFAMSQIFQGVCLLHAPSSPWEEYYRAVVCGVSLEPSIEKSLLVDLGLIHIIVVSGSHLVFLSRILKEGMKLSWGTFIFLLIFVAMTGMEPPVVRAFVSLTLSLLVKRFKLFLLPLCHSTVVCSCLPGAFSPVGLLPLSAFELGSQFSHSPGTKCLFPVFSLLLPPCPPNFKLDSVLPWNNFNQHLSHPHSSVTLLFPGPLY